MFLGTGDEDKPLHCADFNFDENILLCGLNAYLKLILKGNEEFEVL